VQQSLAPDGIRVPRVLGRLTGRRSGPTLVVVGGLHGNEPAGALALQRVFARLGGRAEEVNGQFVGLAGNVKALARNQRFLREDLNRIWLPERIARVRASVGPLDDEDEELAALDRELTRADGESRGPLIVFDLHSVSGPGPAFVTLDDTLANRALAFRIPAPCVLGLEEELKGTLTEYCVSAGRTSFGFEAGQLYDPRSVDRAEAAVWIVLQETGILAAGQCPDVERARALLVAESGSLPPVVEVRHRHAITPPDVFRMRPGFVSFQTIAAGELLASSRNGDIEAPSDGLILMPLYQAQGSDGFFIVRPVHGFWLRLSSLLRRVPLHGLLAWLPGVVHHPDTPGGFVVDTQKARWLALQLFHLLGFKRQGRLPHGLVMVPRRR
jgi:succinylglutamate desuccinylase